MKVKAQGGVMVPREENPRRYITSDTVLEVAETAYYLRRIADGDLVIVTENNTVPATEPASATSPLVQETLSPATETGVTGTDTEEESQ